MSAPLTALDDVTTTVTHELAEAATNPFVNTQPGFSQEDTAHAIWDLGTFGGEVADMCQSTSGLPEHYPHFRLHASWCSAAGPTWPPSPAPQARASPCRPTGPIFLNSYPTLPDMVTVGGNYFNAPFEVPGVLIPVGSSKTIDVVLASEAPTSGPWTVTVTDLSYYVGDSNTPATTLSLDKTTGKSATCCT